MADYHTFTAARSTEPDFATLQATLKALDASAGIQHAPDTQTYVLKKATAWTAPQMTAAQNAVDTAPALSNTSRFTATSRQKDVLATCALIARARGIAAWNGMTVQQKKDAALAEADVWVTIRNFIEDNV